MPREAELMLAEIIDEILRLLRRYVVFRSAAQRLAVALWILHTHIFDQFETTPYLSITSPEMRCGKSKVLTILKALAARSSGPWVLPSEAAVFRIIEDRAPTLLLDEMDAVWGPRAREHEHLRALLNAGFQSDAVVPRCVGANREQVKDFRVYCPKALAAIGTLPDTIADRAIPICLVRKARGEHAEKLRQRRFASEADELLERIARWAEGTDLTEAEPLVPDALSDRAQDAWEPLLAIAEAAGPEIAEAARHAAVELHADAEDVEASRGVRLLDDLRGLFRRRGVDRMFTDEILEPLYAIEDAPWGDDEYGRKLNANAMARLLRPFGIKPKTVRRGTATRKGYFRQDFEDSWSRYLPQEEEETSHRHTDAKHTGCDGVTDEGAPEEKELTCERCRWSIDDGRISLIDGHPYHADCAPQGEPNA
jgi:hypothetical protein